MRLNAPCLGQHWVNCAMPDRSQPFRVVGKPAISDVVSAVVSVVFSESMPSDRTQALSPNARARSERQGYCRH